MNTRRITLLIAILLAIVTGWLTLNYVRGVQETASNDTTPRTILVAAAEIPARATITPAMLTRVTRPASNVEPDALANPQSAVGALALITIPAGSTISASKIGRPSDAALPVRLASGMRAVTIQIDRVKGIAGLIEPGDRVDVIAIPPRAEGGPPAAATILRGVRVLAIGTSLETAQASPSPQDQNSSTATLEVTPKQADLLAMADVNTTLRLAARSPREPLSSLPTEALHFAENNPAPQAAAPAAAPAAPVAITLPPQMKPAVPAAAVPRGVPIIDGDRLVYSGTGTGQ